MRRAFDCIDRTKLAGMLRDRLQSSHSQEARCLIAMLFPGESTLTTPWGPHEIKSNSGVKQGAVESPSVVVCPAGNLKSWFDTGVQDVAFMDDALLWDGLASLLQAGVNTRLSCGNGASSSTPMNACSLHGGIPRARASPSTGLLSRPWSQIEVWFSEGLHFLDFAGSQVLLVGWPWACWSAPLPRPRSCPRWRCSSHG